MILLDELKNELVSYLPEIKELADVLNIENSKIELEELRNKASEPGFWDDLDRSQKVLQKTKAIENKIESLEKLSSQLEDLIALTELCIEENDESSSDEISEGLESFKAKLESEKLATLLTGEYDNLNAIVTFHAGAGGTEAYFYADTVFLVTSVVGTILIFISTAAFAPAPTTQTANSPFHSKIPLPPFSPKYSAKLCSPVRPISLS